MTDDDADIRQVFLSVLGQHDQEREGAISWFDSLDDDEVIAILTIITSAPKRLRRAPDSVIAVLKKLARIGLLDLATAAVKRSEDVRELEGPDHG